MTYNEVIAWIEQKYVDGEYDLFSKDDIPEIRQQLLDDFDSKGSVDAFLEKISGTRVERRIFEKVEEPLIEELNTNIEQQVGGEITEATTADDVADISVPPNLIPDTIDRLEEAKNVKFGELRGEELREEIEDPESELSLKDIGREAKKLPDEAVRQDLLGDVKEEQSRLKDINQSFLENIREQTDEGGLDVISSEIEASDLRAGQKESLGRIADARRELGFPESTEL